MSIWEYPIRVAGISFRVQSMDEVSDEVLCEREATNPHDPLAVAVYSVSGDKVKHIGYLPKEIARNIPDHDLPCRGTVVWKSQGSLVGIRIAI